VNDLPEIPTEFIPATVVLLVTVVVALLVELKCIFNTPPSTLDEHHRSLADDDVPGTELDEDQK
jgi:hypothetical protein